MISGSSVWTTRYRLSCLFGGHRWHIDRHIFAAEFASMESHAAFDEREQGVVLAEANARTRIYLGAALTDNDVTADDIFATELLYAKTTAC
jgi:hypothetical protein